MFIYPQLWFSDFLADFIGLTHLLRIFNFAFFVNAGSVNNARFFRSVYALRLYSFVISSLEEISYRAGVSALSIVTEPPKDLWTGQ